MAGAHSGAAPKNIPIDFSSAESLPDSHTWWSHGCSDIIDGSVSIPVVDLKDPNAMDTLKLACEEWGVFQLKNHGIPLSLLKEVDDEIKRFFALPTEQKEKALRLPGATAGYGSPYISSFFPKVMWHEGFTIVGSSYDEAKKVLPDHDLARFRETIEEIQNQLKVVTEKVTGAMLELLGVRDEEKKWVKSDNMMAAFQMNLYPICPDPDRAIGFAQHKDTSIVTFLHQTQVEAKTLSEIKTQDQTSGLQIFKEGIGWVPVRPDPEAFVVQLGDILEILSNGRFTSVLHRVTVSGTANRYSYAFFHRPSFETLISPFESPPRFRALTLREYDALKAKDRPNALASISI